MQTCPGVFRGNDIAAGRGYELQLQSLVEGIKHVEEAGDVGGIAGGGAMRAC